MNCRDPPRREQSKDALVGIVARRPPVLARPRALSRFDVTVISRYFPEFERELPRYLSPS
jgi:hypothetical protein